MIDYSWWLIFILVFIRTGAFLAASPVFSLHSIPNTVKIGLAFVLTLILVPQAAENSLAVPDNLLLFIVMAVKETLAGLAAGMAATLIFSAVRIGGQYLDIQMGFAMAQIIDPANGMQNTLVAQFLYILGGLLFFAVDAHHQLILALTGTFDLIPLGSLSWTGSLTLRLVDIFFLVMAYALRIALPVVIVLVITDLSLGFLSKAVPQFNVFMAGFPLKIGIGVLALGVLMPATGTLIGSLFELLDRQVLQLFGGY